jgi:hypothetical protein
MHGKTHLMCWMPKAFLHEPFFIALLATKQKHGRA